MITETDERGNGRRPNFADMGNYSLARSNFLEAINFWYWSGYAGGFRINFSFSSPLRNRVFLDNFLLAFLIQSTAELCRTWWNDWRRQDNASTTFSDRPDRRPDPDSNFGSFSVEILASAEVCALWVL